MNQMRKIELVKRSDGSFIPAHNSDHELSKRVAPGDSIEGRIVTVRNLRYHKRFFALIRYTRFHMNEDKQAIFPSEDSLRLELTLQAGYWDKHYTMGGKEVIYPRSISFDNMDQVDFETLYNGVLDVILKWFLPEIDQEQLLNFM